MKTTNRLLLAESGLSSFAVWIDFLAVLTLSAYHFHVTSYQMALVSAAGIFPSMLIATWAGKLCDRNNPKNLIIIAIAMRVVITAGILYCENFTLFISLIGLRSLFATVPTSAINVIAVNTIKGENLPRFYSQKNIITNATKVLAPAIGVMAGFQGDERLSLKMAVIFSVLSMIIISRISYTTETFSKIKLDEHTEKEILTPVSAGIDYISLLWMAVTYSFFVFMVNNLLPLILENNGFDKSLFGLLVVFSGAGNVISGLWLAKRPIDDQRKIGPTAVALPAMLQASGFVAIGGIFCFHPPMSAPLLTIMSFATGACSARYFICLSVFQLSHFANMMGTSTGAMQTWQYGAIFIAPLFGAWVLDNFDAPTLYWFAATFATISFSALFGVRRVTKLRQEGNGTYQQCDQKIIRCRNK